MLSIEELNNLADQFANELREYRLSGDLQWLLPLLNTALNAQQNCDINKIRQEFFNALTSNEEQAFRAIREEIGSLGNISVVKMIQKTNISRPVWTSLLQKMDKYGVAQVKNQGVKGTYIEIIKGV